MGEKIAVHCPTMKEIISVATKAGKTGMLKWTNNNLNGRENLCVYLDGGSNKGCDEKVDCIRGGYTIITAEEYLKEGEFKVGDRVEYKDKEYEIFHQSGEFNSLKNTKNENDQVGGVHISDLKLKEREKKGNKFDDSLEDLTISDIRTRILGRFVEDGEKGEIVKINLNNKKEEKMNKTIKKVFAKDEFQLVERMNAEFGVEFSENTFQNEIDLADNKGVYVKELERREEVRKAEADKE